MLKQKLQLKTHRYKEGLLVSFYARISREQRYFDGIKEVSLKVDVLTTKFGCIFKNFLHFLIYKNFVL